MLFLHALLAGRIVFIYVCGYLEVLILSALVLNAKSNKRTFSIRGKPLALPISKEP